MKLLIFLALLVTCSAVRIQFDNWHCGNGFFSDIAAWLIARPSGDRDYISNCCKTHDIQYDAIIDGTSKMSKKFSDILLKRCLQNSNDVMTRHIVSELYHAALVCNHWIDQAAADVKQFVLDTAQRFADTLSETYHKAVPWVIKFFKF